MSIDELQRIYSGATHPLDPLTAEEIVSAVVALKRNGAHAESLRFVQVELKEPPKRQLRDDPGAVGRQASAVMIDRGTGQGYAATVDLVSDTVVAWQQLPPGSQPPVMLDEFET